MKREIFQGTRLSRPPLIVPRKMGMECAFRKGCMKECLPALPAAVPAGREKFLRREIEGWLQELNVMGAPADKKEASWKETCAKELIFMLGGTVVAEERAGKGAYSLCGDEEVGGARVGQRMQAYTPSEMREITRELPLDVDLMGAYCSVSRDSPPYGMSTRFAMLLARISAIQLPGNREALEILMRDGGVKGMRMLSWMAAEPVLEPEVRAEYVDALHRLASCASVSGGEVEPVDIELASALSRFLPMENTLMVIDGDSAVDAYPMEALPEIPAEPNPPGLRQMLLVAAGEFFQGMVNIAGRLDSILGCSRETIEAHKPLVADLYRSLERGLRLLLDGKSVSTTLLEGFFGMKRLELYGNKSKEAAEADMDVSEQLILKHVVRKLEGEVDPESVEQLGRVLTANPVGMERVQLLEQCVSEAE